MIQKEIIYTKQPAASIQDNEDNTYDENCVYGDQEFDFCSVMVL